MTNTEEYRPMQQHQATAVLKPTRSIPRPRTRKPYNHPWWRHAYGWYERSIDNLHDDFPLVYYTICAALVVAGWFVSAALVAMFA